jgi:hypothetical protein
MSTPIWKPISFYAFVFAPLYLILFNIGVQAADPPRVTGLLCHYAAEICPDDPTANSNCKTNNAQCHACDTHGARDGYECVLVDYESFCDTDDTGAGCGTKLTGRCRVLGCFMGYCAIRECVGYSNYEGEQCSEKITDCR